jgi:hypothetical protein
MNRTVRAGSGTISVFVLTTPVASLIKGFSCASIVVSPYSPTLWRVFEAPGVEPVFLEKDQAIGYAETRARLRTGEVRIFDSTGEVERVIAFDDTNRRL